MSFSQDHFVNSVNEGFSTDAKRAKDRAKDSFNDLKLTLSPNLRVWSSVESRTVGIHRQIQDHVFS